MDARAGSLWHKIAGEAIPRSNPRHRGGPVCSCVGLFIFHGKSSLAFNIGLRQEDGPGGFPQPVLVDSHIPLVGLDVILPNFLKISVENRNRLVNVKLTEM